ncbi:MAG: hypothetical protein KKE50_03175 [Nanoarchaeota archaeon]|nr:hypothetical protein [Nanoarchaeota archaeon]
MEEEKKVSRLEETIDKTFIRGYEYSLSNCSQYHGYITKAIGSLPYLESQNPFQNSEFLNYLANPDRFNQEKILILLHACDKFFENKQNRKNFSLEYLLPNLFIGKIRDFFISGLSSEEERLLKTEYEPAWILDYKPNNEEYDSKKHPSPFEFLRRISVQKLAECEKRMADNEIIHLPTGSRINFSLSALKHFEESCRYGRTRNPGHYGYLGGCLSILGGISYALCNQPSGDDRDFLIRCLSEEFQRDLEKIPEDLGIYAQLLNQLKKNSVYDFYLFCLSQAIECREEFFKRLDKGEKLEHPKKTDKTYITNKFLLAKDCFYLASVKAETERTSFLQKSRESFGMGLGWKLDAESEEIKKIKEESLDELGMLRDYAIFCRLARNDPMNAALKWGLEVEESLQLLNSEKKKV